MYLAEFPSETIWSWTCFLQEGFLFLQIWFQFQWNLSVFSKLSTTFLFSFGRLCVSRNLSSSSRLYTLLACNCFWYFLLVLLCCAIFVVISLVLFLLFLEEGEVLSFLKVLGQRFVDFVYSSKEPALGFIDIFLLKNPLFIYSLTFIVSFLILSLGFVCLLCNSFRWQVVFLICDFSEKGLYCCELLCALAASHRFSVVVFSLYLSQDIF